MHRACIGHAWGCPIQRHLDPSRRRKGAACGPLASRHPAYAAYARLSRSRQKAPTNRGEHPETGRKPTKSGAFVGTSCFPLVAGKPAKSRLLRYESSELSTSVGRPPAGERDMTEPDTVGPRFIYGAKTVPRDSNPVT